MARLLFDPEHLTVFLNRSSVSVPCKHFLARLNRGRLMLQTLTFLATLVYGRDSSTVLYQWIQLCKLTLVWGGEWEHSRIPDPQLGGRGALVCKDHSPAPWLDPSLLALQLGTRTQRAADLDRRLPRPLGGETCGSKLTLGGIIK